MFEVASCQLRWLSGEEPLKLLESSESLVVSSGTGAKGSRISRSTGRAVPIIFGSMLRHQSGRKCPHGMSRSLGSAYRSCKNPDRRAVRRTSLRGSERGDESLPIAVAMKDSPLCQLWLRRGVPDLVRGVMCKIVKVLGR